jgi:hypothetical protein
MLFQSQNRGPERRRICQQVARGEKVLVLFSGVGMEALQIAGRTEASGDFGHWMGTSLSRFRVLSERAQAFGS